VSHGPGSYTGLRIGVSAAKGLCYALGIPLIAVDTLKILAQAPVSDGLIIPMIDARRMEVYSDIYF
jgi:tRNA threonylcarbamoyladenosine biosynthesis protein TsaB